MHIYPWQIDPTTGLLRIDALNTTTPNLADLLADLPQSIEHRCLEYHYTKLGRSTGRSSPSQLSIDALNTATPNLADLPADLPPSQLSTDVLNTATPNLADLPPSAMHHGMYIMGYI